MAITKVINDAVDLNQTSDYSGLRLPVGTTGDIEETFTTEYLVVAGGGGTSGDSPGGGGGGGLRTSYNSSTTTTNSLSFPSGKTAIATYMLNNNANDISGNYNGTETNITYAQGKYGGAAVFNGSSSYISTSLNADNISTITYSVWVYWKSDIEGIVIGGTGNDGASGRKSNRQSISLNGANNRFDYVTRQADFCRHTTSLPEGWHHFAVVDNNSADPLDMKMYIDGSSVTFSTPILNGNYSTNTALQIGRSRKNDGTIGSFFNSHLDQVRIYDTELSSTDVSNIYNNEVQANSGGGVAAETSLTLTAGVAYDVTVGAGGASNTIGSSSIFSTITSTGGGRGGGNGGGGYNGGNGGSGGGGAGGIYSSAGGNGTTAQGYAGGSSGANTGGTSYPGGGGGGAVSVGASPSGSGDPGGNGGAGLAVNILNATNAASANVGEVSSSNVYYSGGGGGSTYQGTPGNGGLGGAGDGDRSDDGTSANNGTINTGGGGGGTNATGGSGVVILRYPTASVSSFTTTGTLNTPSTTDTLANNNYPTTNTAYYKLDGNATDSSGNGNNGTASNITWSNGRFGQAAVFNGSSSKLTNMPFIAANSSYSISLWFKTSSSARQSIIASNSSTHSIALNINNGQLAIHETDVGDSDTFTGTWNDGNWHHLVMVNKSAIWVDGVSRGTTTQDLFENEKLEFGYWEHSGPIYYFNGSLDQIRILSTSLSSSQITELYNEHYQTQFTDGSDTAIVFTEGTGTVTFSGIEPAPPQGALRTNTSYSEDGSASVIEHYNGTDWKRFDAIKYCTTNKLNFPSGAGCIASYNLNNNVDDIGNTYNGVNSNVTFTASGKFGAAAVFNGSSSVITLPALPITTSSNVTFSAWIKGSTDATDATIVSTLGENGLEFRVNNSAVRAVYRKGSSWYASSTVSITADAWNHVVLTYEQGVGFNIYVNNNTPTIYAETGTLSILGSSNTIGKYANGSSGYFDGLIDQVRIFNDSLTSDEVSKLYNNEIACS